MKTAAIPLLILAGLLLLYAWIAILTPQAEVVDKRVLPGKSNPALYSNDQSAPSLKEMEDSDQRCDVHHVVDSRADGRYLMYFDL